PELPPYVNQALMKALSKDREDRYASCSEFAKALAPPPTFYEKNMTGILSVTIIFLAVCLFSMSSFLRTSPYTQQVLTYSHTDRNLTFGNAGDKLSFLVVHGEDENQSDSEEPEASVPVSNTRVPHLTLEGQVIDLAKATSGKGWSCTAMNADEIVMTLDGYTGGGIKASALNLKLVLADGTKNIFNSEPGQIGLELHDGNLTITGGTQGTATLEVLCQAAVKKEEKDATLSSPAAILVGGKGKSFTLEHIASFLIQTTGSTDGIMVERGKVNTRQVASVKIDCPKNRNAIRAAEMSIIANKSDKFDLAGGLCLRGPLSVFDAEKPDVQINRLPFAFKLSGSEIDRLAGTEAELIEALARVSIDAATVILLTNDIETTPRQDDTGHTVSTLSVARGHHILLSSGHRVIRKGPKHSREEELLFVKGRLSLGSPLGMGTSTILFDGGCERKLAAQEPITFNYDDGRVVEIAKYNVSGSSAVTLVSVNGFLNMYDGVVIANNVNLKNEPERDNAAFDYARGAGGVFVDHSGTFEMFGGRIQNCESPFGSGVSVRGTFLLRGGEIIGNTCNNGNGIFSSEGAGVFVVGGKFEMSGGTLCNNFALSNASSANGSSSAKGAGVHLSFHATCKLTGGVIRNNHSMWAGGGIYVGGRGTSTLEVSQNARIENNTGVIGAGIFMNAPVRISGGSVAHNTLLKGPSATMPAGAGVYFLPMSNISGITFPCLFLSDKVSFSPDNRIFISSSNRTDLKEQLLFDERFYPIIVTGPLTGDPATQHFAIDGGSFLFSERNEVPLVGLRCIKEGDTSTLNKMSGLFSFGFLGVPDNKNFKLVSRTIELKDVVTGKARQEYCLSVTPK
ncbi:MAG: hypothetical protein Q4G59_03835, partial [Planctomycetia bacterium]|nr:hypothetical protein [Planctomycetia bacterium]